MSSTAATLSAGCCTLGDPGSGSVHGFFTVTDPALTTVSHPGLDHRGMADLLVVLGTLGATGAFLALILALERL